MRSEQAAPAGHFPAHYIERMNLCIQPYGCKIADVCVDRNVGTALKSDLSVRVARALEETRGTEKQTTNSLEYTNKFEQRE